MDETMVSKEQNKEKAAKVKSRGNHNIAYMAVAVIVVVIAVVAFLEYSVINASAAVGDTVSVYYTGSFTNGTVFGTNVGGTPLNFTIGAGQIIPGFNDAVIGMHVGQTKNVTIPPSEGYGYVNQSKIISVPISDFGSNVPKVGGLVATSTGIEGEVTAVNTTNVTVDFNSPLAGKTLLFSIKLLAIRK